jgi:hypothetical protein
MGDAIIVIAADLEGNHKANAKIVARKLEEAHIRMFGLALGPVTTKNAVAGGLMTSTTSQGMAYSRPSVGELTYITGDDNFFPLTTNSGGIVFGAMNSDSHRSYSMKDPHVLQDVRQKARSVSKIIMSMYRIQVDPPQMSHPEGWNLEINENLRKQTQPMFVLYPHELGPC